jgi:hypothetical protein
LVVDPWCLLKYRAISVSSIIIDALKSPVSNFVLTTASYIAKRFEADDVLTLCERRAFALKSRAGNEQSHGRVAVRHRKVNAAPVFEAGKSDMTEPHVLIRGASTSMMRADG